MRPELIAAIITGTGLAVNTIWTIHNLHVKAEIRKMVDELKDYVRTECVDRSFCNERNVEILRRLEAIGG